ncbi:PH domain-containing protein [Rufibacter quisquiliarum]|uniref:Uncharacterized protein YyaB-like PH domain-containing protein n=1 Tax=Rufibacter quisquiliarum TaxID=1549639 RepID=A0A839GNJ2_9BACT|nr:PH domain-containing protein [Rufibacter quisquiliarum]MBA9075998.1 hypothetical protein [Rufibacter quisquiliarum]
MLLLVVTVGQVLLTREFTAGTAALALFLVLVLALLLWIWFGTYYMIDGTMLVYASGPIKGKIDIHTITHIKPREKLWSGLKPSLGLDGLVIYYNKWDEIYLSPKEKEQFIQQLRQVKEEIVVEG